MNLKIQLTRFLYKETIEKIEFFKNRSNRFYLSFLEKLKPMRFDSYQLIWDKGSKPKSVYFILKGRINNEDTDR